MRFLNHFREQPPLALRNALKRYDRSEHKIEVWNAFVDSGLTGVNDDDCAILPRVLPASYLPVIERTAREITTFALRLLSLPENEIRAILPSGPVADFLIHEIGVLKHRPRRLTGSFRFDMAIVGEALSSNPPKLLEINEIGFDGLGRSAFIQQTLMSLIPELREKTFALDTARAEVRNMLRLGKKIARIQYDSYNWDEEFQVRTAKALGAEMRLVSPLDFKVKVDPREYPMLAREKFTFGGGRVKTGSHRPDAIQMSFAYSLEDYEEAPSLYGGLVRAKTPLYGPFITGLVASKMVLVLLSDKALRRKLLGSEAKLERTILPAYTLGDRVEETRRNASRLVIKHVDGYGGEQVFLGNELVRTLKRIPERERGHWVAQQRARLNTLGVHGILSRPRSVISDLGVFVQYDWAGGKFRHFGVGGFITRATNKSFKVNVSGGGIQVPVFFLHGL
jgi:hypothetical protein